MSPFLLVLLAAVPAADDRTGEQIYKQMCLRCHGATGEGTKEHPEPLVGVRTLDKLTLYVEKKMPEDEPGKCVGEDAKKVSEYIYNAFYSRAAQARAKPPRIELSHLTVRQYRNAVADLLGGFSEQGTWDDKRGLRAEHFNGPRRFRDDKRVLERVDRTLAFDFGKSAPSEKVGAEEYSIRWSGGLYAPETGEYEINLVSENGVRLWLNDQNRSLIDALVRSGSDKNHRETITLLGGRVYPIRVEFFRAKNDKTGSIFLRWKRPGRGEEIVAERYLSPSKFPEVLVATTAFPPDDRSMGYERSTSVSKAWDEATTDAALEVAGFVGSRLATLAPGKAEPKTRLRDLARKLTERAFRRPLTPEQQTFFVDRFFESETDPEMALKKTVLLALKSPRFLYPDAGSAENDAYAVASRISFGLWDSAPDADLLAAAKAGRLGSATDIGLQIERMMSDQRTRAKLREFYQQWLQLDRLHELSKDAKRYPDFDEGVISDLRISLDLFLDDVSWSDASDFRLLLQSEAVFLNGRLAKFYGEDLPADAPFQKMALARDKNVGILTHPLLMAGFAYDSTSSPIHRGLFVARSLLGKRLRPPPEAQTPVSPELQPQLSTRERIALQTRAQACQSCHAMINPLGFALEHYDAVGRYRDKEKDKPIDATGSYATAGGDEVQFNGARQLADFLVKSEETQTAFIEHLFQYFLKQPVRAYGADRPEQLRKEFVKNAFSIRRLLGDVIAASAQAGGRTTKGKNP